MRHHVGEITVDIDGVTYVYRVHQLTHNQSFQIFLPTTKTDPETFVAIDGNVVLGNVKEEEQ